jgi:large repetitive protein
MNLITETRVNTFRNNEQTTPDIAVLADGSYVTVWRSYSQDATNTYGIYWQRFNASGAAIGGEFRANSSVAGTQIDPHAAATSDGGFVITWDDQNGFDGSGIGIVAQRYNAAGVAQGANFVANTTTNSTQNQNAVVGYSGGFAISWAAYDSAVGDYDIYVQRFDNAGAKVGAETLVGTAPGVATDQTGTQQTPDMAASANGNLLVVWTDQSSNDGSSYGVYGRLFNAATSTFGSTFLVNTTTNSTQYEPSVTWWSGATTPKTAAVRPWWASVLTPLAPSWAANLW